MFFDTRRERRAPLLDPYQFLDRDYDIIQRGLQLGAARLKGIAVSRWALVLSSSTVRKNG
jgi:hypothetical protein